MAESDSDLIGRIMATFAGEARERVQAMTRDVLVLEGSRDPAAIERLLASLLHEAHSLKGAARSVDVRPVELLAHRLESVFEELRRDALEPEPSVCDALLHAIDAIGALVHEATTGEPARVDVAELTATLDDPRGGVRSEPPAGELVAVEASVAPGVAQTGPGSQRNPRCACRSPSSTRC